MAAQACDLVTTGLSQPAGRRPDGRRGRSQVSVSGLRRRRNLTARKPRAQQAIRRRTRRRAAAVENESPIPVPTATYAATQAGHFGMKATTSPGISHETISRTLRRTGRQSEENGRNGEADPGCGASSVFRFPLDCPQGQQFMESSPDIGNGVSGATSFPLACGSPSSPPPIPRGRPWHGPQESGPWPSGSA